MFDMNPHHLPDAQMQHWIMLFVAGTLGFIIGYGSRRRTANKLETDLGRVSGDLDDVQRTATVPTVIGSNPEETSVLQRIAGRAHKLNIDRIGQATAEEADDLNAIVGIGPFLVRKLNAVSIYTYRQIANFTQDDAEQVNDVIEIVPGRIKREKWVEQAAQLAKNKE